MRLFLLLLAVPLAAQQKELDQLARTFRTPKYYSATFISSRPTDVIVDGVLQRQVERRKVRVSGRKKRMEISFGPASSVTTDERIIIINDDQEWQLTPAAKLVYIVRSPDLQREPYEAVVLRRASQLKDAHFLPDETITLDEGPPHRCRVIEGKLEVEGPVSHQVFEHPVTYWIDRKTGFPAKVVDGDTIVQIVSFTPKDKAALDQSQYVYTPQPDWKRLEVR